MERQSLKIIDPVERQPEEGFGQDGMSPMDPPEAYEPPGTEKIALEDLHPFLRALTDDHARLEAQLELLETALLAVKESGFTREADHAVMRFLSFFDHEFIPHSQLEEAALFPLLKERLIADGEHSQGSEKVTTGVDVMLREHLKSVQSAAVVLNLLRLGSVLPDQRSAFIVIDAALKEAENLIELLRLHMFREDNIVFGQAQRLLSSPELDAMPRPKRPHPH